ncbi:MAG: WecB/TagA/CpsF family glycosyltransferase [Telmatospirillum sp.]|nr:WecB/TagA/CpsF family glycosyltransferase [Telmatospirillum sp.]
MPVTTDILGVPLHMTTLDGAVREAGRWICEGRRAYICHVNVHSLTASRDDPRLRAALAGADLAATDGMPLVWIGRSRGFDCGRVYGPDLMEALCRATAGWRGRPCRHFLYGATAPVLEALRHRLAVLAPGVSIAGTLAPPMRPLTPEEEAQHRQQIDASGAHVVWVGLGAPRQELWMARNRPLLKAELLVGVGAAFDFLAGTKPQAPVWMRRAGLEWAFRLATEPRRLAWRYLSGNSRFLALLMASAIAGRIRPPP